MFGKSRKQDFVAERTKYEFTSRVQAISRTHQTRERALGGNGSSVPASSIPDERSLNQHGAGVPLECNIR